MNDKLYVLGRANDIAIKISTSSIIKLNSAFRDNSIIILFTPKIYGTARRNSTLSARNNLQARSAIRKRNSLAHASTNCRIIRYRQASHYQTSENIFNSNELEENSVCSILELTAADGKTYKTKIYNLDAILSVGYRVNSKNATSFRCWANKILKEYLLRGYSINKRLNNIEQRINNDLPKHEQRIGQIEEKIDFFVRTALPPVEGIFFEGQIFDAYVFASNLIKSAQKQLFSLTIILMKIPL